MVEISAVNFTDHLAVSTELVKFLSLNTSVEAVDTLIEKSESMSTAIANILQDVAGVVKSTTTVGSKQELMSTQIKELTKKSKSCRIRSIDPTGNWMDVPTKKRSIIQWRP